MIVYSGQTTGLISLSDVWVLSNANGLGGTPARTQLSPTGGSFEGHPVGFFPSTATWARMAGSHSDWTWGVNRIEFVEVVRRGIYADLSPAIACAGAS